MNLGFWKLKVTASIGNTKNWTIFPSGAPLSVMRSETHREDQYDLTDSSWVSVRL
jgi:hypothetical protein